jgi:hypothetical protein
VTSAKEPGSGTQICLGACMKIKNIFLKAACVVACIAFGLIPGN